jgi:aspartate racemase
MSEKVVGILGGMGPEATLDCFGKLLRSTRAERDQEHLRVLIDSNSKVPDRTAAILGKGPSPVPALVESALLLGRAGADFLIIPCVSAHVFLDEVRARVDVPIVSMFDVVAEAILAARPAVRTIGLLGTTGTIRGGLFQNRLARDGIAALVPDDADQDRVMRAIYDIKNLAPSRPRSACTADLVGEAEGLVARGAQAIVAGCTEIPLALRQENLRVPYFDSVLVLARAAVARAGGTLA